MMRGWWVEVRVRRKDAIRRSRYARRDGLRVHPHTEVHQRLRAWGLGLPVKDEGSMHREGNKKYHSACGFEYG